MTDYTIRSENVDVEQIMRQIRSRIKEKRGVDYTEDEVRQLASVKLETFLNPRAVRSDLVEHYRRRHQTGLPPGPPPPENYEFEAETIYHSHRAAPLIWIRKLLNPILKLFFNPNPIIHALHRQVQINAYVSQRLTVRDELDALNFEVLNNIVLELTRLGIEVKNLKMRIESMNTRQEFNERRARTFEGMVQVPTGPTTPPVVSRDLTDKDQDTSEARSRRRRRRRGRRRPDGEAGGEPQQGGVGPSQPAAAGEPPESSSLVADANDEQ